ncbi:PepSY-associated TM helix domain-containing protein [Sphingosinicella humi]|uniref:PepSY-associated TM helix domain-containing protein n=1 Tax=Allosphingosinicella humi TaxID=2068657 RepID=UPI001FB0DE00|nr:PepSY-associated TM helix domain-containing protein [Sphingosinicella humi]
MTRVAPATEVAPFPPKALPKKARLWWVIHQWAGLKLSIFMSFVLLTGTLAVFSHEMDWLMRPALRVEMSSVSGPVNWPAIARNVAAHAPGASIRSLDAPLAKAFAATATIESPDGELRFVYAHPTTGEVQGDGHWVGAARILRNMHRHLNMPTWLGVPIVSSLALLLAVSLGTSFVVYKKWWRGFLKPIRLRDARTAWGDFHRLAGVWSLWFVALMILTGLWYLAESTIARAPPHPRTEVPALSLSNTDIAARLGPSLAAARAANPDLDIKRIIFPNGKSGAFQFQGQDEAILVRDRSNAVWTSAATGEPLLVTAGRDLNIHQRISEMADPLHFGTFGGYWTKLPWFLFGALLTALSVSGAALYSLRLFKAERRPSAGRAVAVRAWHGMGHWRWAALALVLTGFAMLPTLFGVAGD